MKKDMEVKSEEEVRQTLDYLTKRYNKLGTGDNESKKEVGAQIDDLKWFLNET